MGVRHGFSMEEASLIQSNCTECALNSPCFAAHTAETKRSNVANHCLQITHHRVAEAAMSNMKTAVATSFDLPLEEKRYAMAENDVQGYGQGYIVSEEQKLDWCDLAFLMTYPHKHKSFKKRPLTVPGFKYVIIYLFITDTRKSTICFTSNQYAI